MKNILILIAFVLLFQGKVCAIKGTSVPGIEESFLISSGQALQKNDLREGALQKLKFSVQKFWKNHQQKIIIGGTVVTAIAFVGMSIALLRAKSNERCLEERNQQLKQKIEEIKRVGQNYQMALNNVDVAIIGGMLEEEYRVMKVPSAELQISSVKPLRVVENEREAIKAITKGRKVKVEIIKAREKWNQLVTNSL